VQCTDIIVWIVKLAFLHTPRPPVRLSGRHCPRKRTIRLSRPLGVYRGTRLREATATLASR
jgi:hypothetical protein